MPEVLSRSGVPIVSDFAQGKGTPLVVDHDTGRGYVLVGSTVTPLGGEVFNVDDYVVEGDTDDSAAFTRVIAALPLTSINEKYGTITLSDRVYTVSSPITFPISRGIMLIGKGKQATIIRPTAAMAGLSVILLNDVRESCFRDMCIEGHNTSPVGACIESRRHTGGAHIPTANEFRNLILGTETADNAVKGIKFTTSTVNENNENHLLYDVAIRQTSDAAISIEHGQSQLHRFYFVSIQACQKGIRTAGGCYNLIGGAIGCRVGGVDFEFASGTYYGHPTIIKNVNIEDGAQTLTAANSAELNVFISGLEKVQIPSQSAMTDIDFDAPGYFSGIPVRLTFPVPVLP
jgi:hypothetical protein